MAPALGDEGLLDIEWPCSRHGRSALQVPSRHWWPRKSQTEHLASELHAKQHASADVDSKLLGVPRRLEKELLSCADLLCDRWRNPSPGLIDDSAADVEHCITIFG